jgi:O-antigen ligase
MTRISATAPVAARSPDTYGRGGGAHSEYMQALAETGWPGFMLWLAMSITILWLAFRYWPEKEDAQRWLALSLTLSLMTFFLHAAVNNMLHDGRVAALVWGSIAILTMQVANRKS